MKTVELRSVRLHPLEANSEHISQAGIRLTSHALLSGLHIPVAPKNVGVLQQLIKKATLNRLPIRAINSVSTSERETFDQQFSSTEEKNRQHEYWLGEMARRVLSRAHDKRYINAYTQLFGLPVQDIMSGSKQKANELDAARRPSRRSNRLTQEIPPETSQLIERFKAHLLMRKGKGEALTPAEQEYLLQEQPSKTLIQTAIAFEEIKEYVHSSVYTPFLKKKTDSKGLAGFVLENYKKIYDGEISVSDISKKAQLLFKDFDDMTGKGHTMVGLVRAAAVIATDTRAQDALLLPQKPLPLARDHSLEMVDVIKTQREQDQAAFGTMFDEVHTFTHALFTTIQQIAEDSELSSITDSATRTQRIITKYIEPLFAGPSIFTIDEKGKPREAGRQVYLLLSQLPEILKLRSALAVLAPQDLRTHGPRFVEMMRDTFASDPEQAALALQYTLDYFLTSTGDVYKSPAPFIARVMGEIPAFKKHLGRLLRSHGFAGEELQYLVTSHIERAWNSMFAFDLYGLSLPGPKAETDDQNCDRYLYDERFNFMMVADGAGNEEGADVAAEVMQAASREELEILWRNGLGYPYLTEGIAKRALVAMVSTAANRMASRLPKSLRDYIYGNPQVIDPQTNSPMQPHPDMLESCFQTTFAGVLPYVENGRTYLAVASVGDSRAYLLKTDGRLVQLTRDDSVLREYLKAYPQSLGVLEEILNRFDGEIPVETSYRNQLIAVSEAIKQEVGRLENEVKIQIITDMIDFLSRVLLFTSSTLRETPGKEIRGLLRLQTFLGSSVWEGIDEEQAVTLDSKVTAIANYFFANRNLVTKFVGIQSGYIREEDVVTSEIMPGEKVFLTTDGFHDSISDPRLWKLLVSQTTLVDQVEAMHKEVLASLGCERLNGELVDAPVQTISVRAKADDGITVVGEELTSRLLEAKNDEEEDTLFLSA